MKPYRYSYSKKEEIEKLMVHILHEGITQSSNMLSHQHLWLTFCIRIIFSGMKWERCWVKETIPLHISQRSYLYDYKNSRHIDKNFMLIWRRWLSSKASLSHIHSSSSVVFTASPIFSFNHEIPLYWHIFFSTFSFFVFYIHIICLISFWINHCSVFFLISLPSPLQCML